MPLTFRTMWRMMLSVMVSYSLPVHAATPLFPNDISEATRVAVELHLSLADYEDAKDKPASELPAALRLEDGTTLALKISPRGRSRRALCTHYPIWLDFKRKQTQGTLFEGQNKLKLVTHCKEAFAKRDYLAAELLTYQLLNLLTDTSFRVRPLAITYVDTETGQELERFGFVIEHKKSLARRLDAELVEIDRVPYADLDPNYGALIGLFQMMIANYDFSLVLGPPDDTCCHNTVPLKVNGKIFPVPYDFDVSGFVNPPYGSPPPNLGIRRLSQRVYRGYCMLNDALAPNIERLMQQREALLDLVETFNEIPNLNHKRKQKFIGDFYELLTDANARDRKIVKKCLG